MAISRREFQLLVERVSRLENNLRALEEQVKVHENRLKPTYLWRTVKVEEQEQERLKKEAESKPFP